eukprot:28539-Pleurochrysis_carterae.AAC.1
MSRAQSARASDETEKDTVAPPSAVKGSDSGAAVESARFGVLSFFGTASGLMRFGQSRCQCLPPQWRQAPYLALHCDENVFDFSARFGPRFFAGPLGLPGLSMEG